MSNHKVDKGAKTNTAVVAKDDYYLSIHELLEADSECSKQLTEKRNKEWILCLLRNSISHLKKAKSN